MSAFVWAQGKRYPVKAQVAGEFLEDLEKREGTISARQVLEESRPEDAVLHPCFTWDDQKAAERWRMKESRDLIGNLKTIKATPKSYQEDDGPKEIKIRAFVRITEGNQAARYGSTWEALAREDARKIIIDNAKAEMEAYVKKYRDILDVASLFDEVMAEQAIADRKEKEARLRRRAAR